MWFANKKRLYIAVVLQSQKRLPRSGMRMIICDELKYSYKFKEREVMFLTIVAHQWFLQQIYIASAIQPKNEYVI